MAGQLQRDISLPTMVDDLACSSVVMLSSLTIVRTVLFSFRIIAAGFGVERLLGSSCSGVVYRASG